MCGSDISRSSEAFAPPATVSGMFEDLFRAYHSVILTAAFNRLNDLGDAENVTAEVFAVAWRHRSERESSFTLPWLYATLRNFIGNEYRRRSRSTRRYERLAAEAAVSVPHAVDDDAVMVRRLVSEMRPDDRELIWMAYWEELTREEMAEILGCSLSAVKVRLFRARERLRVLLEHHEMAGATKGVDYER